MANNARPGDIALTLNPDLLSAHGYTYWPATPWRRGSFYRPFGLGTKLRSVSVEAVAKRLRVPTILVRDYAAALDQEDADLSGW